MAVPQSEDPLPQSAVYVLVPCPNPKRCLSLKGALGTPKYEKTHCEVCAGIGVVPATQDSRRPTAL
jgi:hypothetical protein